MDSPAAAAAIAEPRPLSLGERARVRAATAVACVSELPAAVYSSDGLACRVWHCFFHLLGRQYNCRPNNRRVVKNVLPSKNTAGKPARYTTDFLPLAWKSAFCHTALLKSRSTELAVQIDPRSHVPIYLQIADGVRAAVAAGVYRPGEPLPSLRAMAIQAPRQSKHRAAGLRRIGTRGADLLRGGAGGFSSPSSGRPPRSRSPADGVRRALDDAIRAGQTAGMSAGPGAANSSMPPCRDMTPGEEQTAMTASARDGPAIELSA